MIRTALSLVLLLALLAAGCAEQEPAPSVPTPTETTPSVPGETTLPATEPSETPAWEPDGVVGENEYTDRLELAGGSYILHWRVDGDEFMMAMAGAAPGWVAVGFEPTTAMQDADIVFGWVEDGSPRIVDMFSTGPGGPHPPDGELGGSEDISRFGGSETDGTTVIEFARKMDTGDAYDKAFAPGQTVRIIWAYADTDEPFFMHNKGRGSDELTFGGP